MAFRTILIVTDSRGKLLKPLLNLPQGFVIEFVIRNGTTFNEAKIMTEKRIANLSYVCAYIMAGICSITSKDEDKG